MSFTLKNRIYKVYPSHDSFIWIIYVCRIQPMFKFPEILWIKKLAMAYHFFDTPDYLHQAILCHVNNVSV